ncbi:MAG TPA: SPFH domain-containing protein [Candidatus Saccharimonadales bacterium]|nr:SPFH domain-containing protein [Candidatus Saccharimonadales bacterium]
MDGWFITAIFLMLLAIGITAAWRVFRRKAHKAEVAAAVRSEQSSSHSYSSESLNSKFNPRSVSRWLGFATLAFWIMVGFTLGLSSVQQVSTKHVAAVTSFGKPVGHMDNGLHVKLPWEKVTELDATIQTNSHSGTDAKDDTPCTDVRIANQNTACVDNSIRWRIRGDKADSLFQDYKDTDNIRDSIVTRKLGEILNLTFKSYDPLAVDKTGSSTAPSQDFLSDQATKLMRAAVGEDVDVLEVIVSFEHFDPNTQSRLNALQAEVANTRIATQKQLTADAEAIANGKIAASVNNDPNVLVSKCFDIMTQMVKDKQPIPAGFSCWPNSNGSVVIPGGK